MGDIAAQGLDSQSVIVDLVALQLCDQLPLAED